VQANHSSPNARTRLPSQIEEESLALRERRRAVESVIVVMRERLDEQLTLRDLADIARLSPFYFDRVFRQTTGIPPCRFLSALRVAAAKQLLLTTNLSVTDVCLEVGYSSLGTFVTHFSDVVGVSPRRLRRIVAEMASSPSPSPSVGLRLSRPKHGGAPASQNSSTLMTSSRPRAMEVGREDTRRWRLSGHVAAPGHVRGPIFIGFFPTPVPQGRPWGCTVLQGSGPFFAVARADDPVYVFAAAFPVSKEPITYLLPEDSLLWLGSASPPPPTRNGATKSSMLIELRRAALTDPPLLTVLPQLQVLSGGEV
jgi:AraC-like DNA-binding protein